MILKDEEILKLINNKKTKEQGFRMLIRQTKQSLYWQIRNMVYSHEDTNDILQEVYLKIFSNISSFKGDSSLNTWIYRITNNETLNFLNSKAYKRRKYNADLSQMNGNINHINIAGNYNSDKIQNLLDKAIQTLPDRQRKVFELRYYNNMPFNEMAQIMEVSESSLKTSYHIAEKKIKEFLLNN